MNIKYTFLFLTLFIHSNVLYAASSKKVDKRNISLSTPHTCLFCKETFRGFNWIKHQWKQINYGKSVNYRQDGKVFQKRIQKHCKKCLLPLCSSEHRKKHHGKICKKRRKKAEAWLASKLKNK